jgi:hypothetical protein
MRLVAGSALTILLAGPATGLERREISVPAEEPPFARSTSVVRLSYFNVCTGAGWAWRGAPPMATYGVHFEDATPYDDVVLKTHLLYAAGAPSGYGFTGVAWLMSGFDPTCPGQALRTVLFTPRQGWNTLEWNGETGVPVEDFWVLVRHGPGFGNPAEIVTERGAGADGGCGVCYQPSRPVHSFQLGALPYIVCPGAPWFDQSPCFLELAWSSDIRTGDPVSIESTSWGRLKSLYR